MQQFLTLIHTNLNQTHVQHQREQRVPEYMRNLLILMISFIFFLLIIIFHIHLQTQ